ncbi:Uncharacterised protein [Mycobacteroides abscessus subsp. abscessus]|nr:Uncharacterised protein [Mycobacteroides abscessus subsp. abscessus]
MIELNVAVPLAIQAVVRTLGDDVASAPASWSAGHCARFEHHNEATPQEKRTSRRRTHHRLTTIPITRNLSSIISN